MSGGYMDNVRVKISEKYKPPPKINLAMSYSQRLSLNKQIQDVPNYEFVLEKTVVEKMKEWKSARSVMLQKPPPKLLVPMKAESDILIPIPLKQQSFMENVSDKSPFNISDFEADTSSPFDNMELKSINNLEALAQVLKTDSVQNKPTFPAASTGNYNIPQFNSNGFYNFTKPTVSDTNKPNINEIMKSLQSQLNHCVDNKVSTKIQSKHEDLDDLMSLPTTMQEMTKSISSMGFPLSRVARVCKIVGDDQKKVVEHLLAMSELLDLGFPEGKVSDALLQSDNDRDKALDILIS